MTLPLAVDALWHELETVRNSILKEVEGLSQSQADWRPSERDWSIGELIHHLTLAEVATGKLTSKLLKEAGESAAPFPAGFSRFPPLPPRPPGAAEAPPVVRPEHGHRVDELLSTFKATRERSRQSIERLAGCDPRRLTFKHFRFGDMDLGQWWRLTAAHDALHLRQIREVKGLPGFPRA
jgi:hypothetical protein